MPAKTPRLANGVEAVMQATQMRRCCASLAGATEAHGRQNGQGSASVPLFEVAFVARGRERESRACVECSDWVESCGHPWIHGQALETWAMAPGEVRCPTRSVLWATWTCLVSV